MSDLNDLEVKVIVFFNDDILLEPSYQLPVFGLEMIPEHIWDRSLKCQIGMPQEVLYVMECSKNDLPLFSRVPLKQFLQNKPKDLVYTLLRAKQLLYWHKHSMFCGACGHQTRFHEFEVAKICLGCSRVVFPTSAQAVMVLIGREEEILLGRSAHFRPGVYSNLAGFIEAGETAEEAIEREVKEEVGIELKNIRYFGSQPWPFENSFMLAYIADYQSGDIVVNAEELEDARWFSIHALPELPFSSNIGRHMIEYYIKHKGH